MIVFSWNTFAKILLACILLAASPASLQTPAARIDWLQFGFDSQHSGNNPQESILSSANAASLNVMFKTALPARADGAPVYLNSITTPLGVKDLLFVTTVDGAIVALDASSGAQVWSRQNPAGTCRINNGSTPCYTTSSPAIDPGRQYVYSYGLDGYVHKYQVGDGTEIKSGGWPELASLKPFDEKGSSALSIVIDKNGTRYLYAASAGYPGDQGDYQGHLTVINLANGTWKVFNTVCSNQNVHFLETPGTPDCAQVQTAIWARPGVVYNPANDRIYLATGNGPFDPVNHDWGDSVFALNPDGSGAAGNPLDSYTPTNYASLEASDADLGSAAPAILPAPAASKVPHLAVQAGKDGLLRLINLDNLSGASGPGHTGGEIGSPISVPQGGGVLPQPSVWVNPANHQTWVFVADGAGLSGLKLVVDGSGNPSLSPVWQHSGGGSSAVIANGVLYFAQSNLIQALSPLDGSILWSSASIGGIHWESPIVVNGVLYITDQSGSLTAFSSFGRVPGYTHSTFFPAIKK